MQADEEPKSRLPEHPFALSLHRIIMRDTMPTVREAVVCLLRELGMTTIFGNPGSTELPLFREFPDDFRYVLGLQESVVVGMADGYAQATRNAALINLHSAAGVGHAMGNIFTAYRNRTPLVITAGQQARSILPYEPFLFASEATKLPEPYVKWGIETARGEDVPAAIARAYNVAMHAPCGPTFVSIPVDDWDRQTEGVKRRIVSHSLHPDPALVNVIGDRLDGSTRPVFVVGPGVDRDDAWDSVVALAERHQALVWVSPMSSRCSFPERHRLFAGFLPAIREQIVKCLDGHDLILALGAPVFTYHIEGFGPHIPMGADLVQMIDDANVAAWTPVGTSIVCSVRHGVDALLERAKPAARPAPTGRSAPPPAAAGDRISMPYLMQTLTELRPADSIIVEESPSSRRTMHDYLPIDRPDSFFTCASGGLGHSLPAMVGVALAKSSSRKVIGIFGDGSAMYSIQALWSAADLKLPVTVVIVNNGGYAALAEFSSHFNIKQLVGTKLPGIDFVGLACSLGCQGVRVERAQDLAPALSSALASPVPILVDVIVGR
jgi:benzoylformate decarboxylase